MSAPRADRSVEALEARCARFRQAFRTLQASVERQVVGTSDVVEALLIAFCARGHVLLEGAPGLGKTRLVRTAAAALGLSHGRVQCTPDLMPADITGAVTLVEGGGRHEFAFQRGPVFAHFLHVDEINRATPKTQAALLEAMQEGAVTVAGHTYPLPDPFLVLATQNPIEMEGTFPLPEAELDRFLFKLRLGLPSLDALVDILKLTTTAEPETPPDVIAKADLDELLRLPREVLVADAVYRRAARIVRATHPDAHEASPLAKRAVRLGASPRAAQALVLGGQVKALLAGRANVAYDDLDAVAPAALRHRLLLTFEAEGEGVDADQVVRAALESAAALA